MGGIHGFPQRVSPPRNTSYALFRAWRRYSFSQESPVFPIAVPGHRLETMHPAPRPGAGSRLNRRRIILAGAATAGVVAVAGLMRLWLQPPRLAPRVVFVTLEGQRLALSSLRGRVVLVTFWATSCPACLRDMPQLVALHQELEPRGLTLIAVAMPYDPPSRVLLMSRQRALPYTVALDVQGKVLQAFGDVPGTPTSFLIDPDGRIVDRQVGPLDFPALKARIMALVEPAA